MSTEIIVNNDIIEINVTEEPIIIEAPSGAYPLPTGVYSVYGRTGNVVAQEGDYTLTLLGDVSIVTPSTGQVLRYNGTAWVNSTESYVGTVTSVAASVPTGLTITGSPITTSGTLAFGLQTGYSIPTTASQTTWDTAYNRSLTSAAVTGTTTKTLTLNQQSGGTITASWTDDNTDAVTSVFGRTGAVVATSGDYTTTQVTEGTNLYYTQTRFNSAFAAKSTTDLAEGTNLYYTDVRARASNSFVAGSGAYNSTTGVITIPTNNNQITNGAAYITLTSLSASAPLSYSNTTGAFSISQANTSTDGYLSSFDWNTFNNKQIALTLGNLTSSDITVTGGTGAVVGTGSTLTLATVNTNVGAYGTSTSVPTITVNGKGLVTAASQTAIPTASSSVTGLLTSANWSTFNDKQNQLNGTGFVKASGTTITYDNSTYLTTIEGIAAGGELSGTYASPSLVNSAVTGKVLTGVNVTGGSISATDSILTAFGKVQNQINGLIGGSIYKGTWNASTNTPTLASGVGTAGNYYIVSVAGTTNLDGITDWQVGDWAIFQGSVWQKVDNTDAVVSVNGFTGAVSLTTSNINEGTNLYYTDARARLSVSGGTGISYNSTSGVITNSAPDQTVTLTGAGTTSISGTYPSFTITSNDTYNGTVTSIGITESVAALSITGSPVTTSGNINIGFAGSPTQYVAGDGSLVTFPTIITEAQNLVAEVYNNTGATLTKGTIVYINGGQGNLPTVTKAIATSDPTSAQTFGFINVDLTNNNNGYVTIIGRLENMDTQAFANGTQLYLSGTTAGTYTSTKPQAPIHLVYVAIVVRSHPTQGVLEVKIQNGVEMDEIHDVQITSIANGNILQYSSADSLWHNVAGITTNIAEGTNLYYTDTRARASISTTATGLTYTSGTGVLSLTAGYVIPTTTSATNWDTAYTNRITSLTTTGSSGSATLVSNTLNIPTYTLAGLGGISLTSLSATTPLSYNNTTGAFTIAQATTSTSGYLSSTDWNTFNGKQAALTNPVTGTGTTNYHTKFTGTSTIGNSLIWDNGTNVGIGNTNTSYTLDVSGTGRFTGALTGAAATFSGNVGINGASASTPLLVKVDTNLQFRVDTYLSTTNLASINAAASAYAAMRIDGSTLSLNSFSGGNVGIGTGTTSGKLTLYQGTAGNVLQSIVSNQGGSTRVGINFCPSMADSEAASNPAQASIYATDYNYSADIIFANKLTGAVGNALTERMRITSGGNVGIGNTGSSTYKLLVTGNTTDGSTFSFYAFNSANVDLFGIRTDGAIYTGAAGNSPYNLTTPSAANCFINTNGYLYRSTSSLKYKKNIQDYTKGLAELLQLRPVSYESINEEEAGNIYAGLIAEEVHDLGLTEFVQYRTDGTPDALSYANMIALLTKAIQEQNQTIQSLQEQINILAK